MIAAKSAGWPSAFRGPARFDTRRTSRPAWVGGFAVLAGLLAIAPLASLVVLAFGDSGDIWPHLARYVLPTALMQTILLLGGVAMVTVLIGVGAAWIVTTFQFPGRAAFIWLLPLPLAIPTYIVAYVYVDILDTLGPVQSALRTLFGWRSSADYWFPDVRSLGGAIFVISFVLYPYVYLAARAMMQTQSSLFMDAARVLGARPWMLARHITLPLARPAIAVGVALALLETLNDIGASEYLGVQTLTLSIFTTWLNRGSLAGAAQIACVMLLLVAALIWLERAGRRGREFSLLTQDSRLPLRIVLKGAAGWSAALACFVPVLLGFLLPAGFLLREVIVRGLFVGFDTDLFRHALTTLGLASAATVIVLLLGFAAVASLRFVRHPAIAACVNVAGIGYAIPGTVLALGLLAPLVLVDEGINALVRALGGPVMGLMLAGSMAALVIAYVIRFLAIAIGFAQAGFSRIAPEFDEVARLLGASSARLARTIHLPLIRPAIWGAALLVFVDCLKELPATLLLRPLNVETLSTYIYQFATRGNFEQGSLAALIIVAVGILPIIRITRYADRVTSRHGKPQTH
jgi:iron(III) transport system permease protein